MAYDSQRGRTVLFGGDGGSSLLGDTWEWDGSAWTNVANGGPLARSGHGMAYDSVRGRTVLFGGLSFLGDTWEWDGMTWTNVTTSGPSARSGHSMAYDSQRGRTVLFGGSGLADTWEWNGSAWTNVATTGPSVGYGMAYDSQRGRTVLFWPTGTWEWDGSAWSQAATVGPGSGQVAMAYDSMRGCTVLVGFVVVSTSLPTISCETWEWSDPAPGTASTFGSGCGNPPLALSPDPSAPPTIGATAQALLSDAPSPFVAIALGWSNTMAGPFPLPVPLDAYGMTGCLLHQSTDIIGLSTAMTGPTTATYGLPLPFWASLIDVHIYLQGYAWAPGMNPASIILSNGLDWQIGY